MIHETQAPIQKAVLVGLHLPKVTNEDFIGSMQELKRLVQTLGYEVIGQVTQKRSSEKSAQVLGDGKLKDLARWTGGTGIVKGYVNLVKTKAQLKREESDELAEEEVLIDDSEIHLSSESDDLSTDPEIKQKADVVVVDHDLSPSQIRNLESATGVPVLDRTGVIIEIFSRHAKTKQARLQVEVARLAYLSPRLRESQMGQDRQGGGIGGKGAGETKLELDKRKIRDRIKELKDEIESLGDQDEVRRARRAQENTVALIGYTNAGKSSLMRALTGSEVYVKDKLFATLDTTIRPMMPESKPKVLISDTVGFIKKLPHDLVASFKSTLDEAKYASLQIHVVDASDPTFRSQLAVTLDVLKEIGADQVPRKIYLNKIDRLSSDEKIKLQNEFPDAWFGSVIDQSGPALVRKNIIEFFNQDTKIQELFIPYNQQKSVAEIQRRFQVLKEEHLENGTQITFRCSDEDFINFQKRKS